MHNLLAVQIAMKMKFIEGKESRLGCLQKERELG